MTKWVQSIGESLRRKLEDHGLIVPVVKMRLGELCEQFVGRYRDQKKAATVTKYEQVKSNLIDYPLFGKDKLIREITQLDVEAWRTWLGKSSNRRDKKRTHLDENTVRRRTGIAKQIFKFAIDSGWLEKNPFNGFACSVQANPEKQCFVSREDIDLALQWAPDAQWRAIVALSRYPLKDVCDWLGNSAAVAMKHYAMATQAQQAKAISELTGKMPDKGHTRGTHSAALEPNQGAAKKFSSAGEKVAKHEAAGTCVPLSVTAGFSEIDPMGEEGLEHVRRTLGKLMILSKRGP